MIPITLILALIRLEFKYFCPYLLFRNAFLVAGTLYARRKLFLMRGQKVQKKPLLLNRLISNYWIHLIRRKLLILYKINYSSINEIILVSRYLNGH